MKDVKVLGPGCSNCVKLYELTKQAANELGIDCSVEKITDIMKITEYGIMMTPAIVVDGEVKISGKVPTLEEIKILLN